MPAMDRSPSRDRELRHQHSGSESGRMSIPMWDSSDPDRYPPSLPLPPGTTNLSTKPNTSAAIQAAANKLHERAQQSVGATYLANVSPSPSPEKSLIRGAAHRRMQSAHVGSAKDLKSYLDGVRTGSPERSSSNDYYASSPSRPETPSRTPLRPILSENTPPSATMRALQTMAAKDDTTLADITNHRTPQATEDVQTQLTKLTTIATGLQEEMASLSRRSKDNAADLLGLREAAKTRDDDIRKNLRDLMSSPTFAASTSPHLPRSTGFGLGLGLLDSKAYGSPPRMPRAASHNDILNPDRIGSSSPFSVEGAASVAMLEKIIREMVTKEGQERLLSNLSELMDRSSKMSSEAVVKVNELSDFIKDKSRGQTFAGAEDPAAQALVRSAQSQAVSSDVNVLLNKIKDSVASNGGLTAEVKALIRELRGEILGMGRELGRKLDEANTASMQLSRPADDAESHAAMQQIVTTSMAELREHLETMIQESARQSTALIQSRNDPSTDDMYSVVKHALAEHGDALTQASARADVDKEDLINAVRTACDNFKPEIELQQYGLERDEILEVLKEGFGEYRASVDQFTAAAVDKQEVFDVISEALQAVQLPQPVFDTHAIKADMLASIRECLEDFKASRPGSSSSADQEPTREMIDNAIRTGFAEHAEAASRVIEISRDDLFDAVKAGLDGSSIPFGGFGEQVLQQLHELVDGMKVEFKQYSTANGHDTEQVLDAVKDGLEVLRGQIENYVDRAQDVTGKDEIIEVIRHNLDNLREDVKMFVENGPASEKKDLLDYIRSEFEHLHIVIGNTPLDAKDGSDKQEILAAIESVRSEFGVKDAVSEMDRSSLDNVKEELAHLRDTLAPLLIKVGAGSADHEELLSSVREAIAAIPSQPTDGISPEILEAIRGEFENLQSSISRSTGNRADMEEMLDTIRLGLDDLRTHVDKKLESPDKHILNGEILDTLNDGLENLRTDVTKSLEKPVDMTVSYEILDTLKEGLAALRADLEKRLPTEEDDEDVSEGQIVLADSNASQDRSVPAAAAKKKSTAKSDLNKVEMLLAQLQIKLEALDHHLQDMTLPRAAEAQGEPLSRTHLTEIEDSLIKIQAMLLELATRNTAPDASAATKADTDAIETLLRLTRSQLEEIAFPSAELLPSRDQMDSVEAVARAAKDAIDALAVKVDESIATKDDVAVVEVLATDVKTALEEMAEKMQSFAAEGQGERLNKEDLDVLGVICTEIKEKVLEMTLPDVETLPVKADIEQLQGLINDLREGHEKFRETYDKDIGVTAQAFDDRKKDTEAVVATIAEVKELLEAAKDISVERHDSHATSLEGLTETLAGIKEQIEGNTSVGDDVKAVIESVKTEFERAHASLEAIQTTHDEHHNAALDKQAEHREAILTGMSERLDPRLDELLGKYEEAHKVAEEKAAAQEATLTSTKELADELKLSIDTLGTALTSSTSSFTEAAEKLSQDSKTVFDRVEDVSNRVDATNLHLQGEHQITREGINRTLEAVAQVQGDMLEHNPQVLISLRELHALVAQHYEHSQRFATDHAEALKGMSESSKAQAEELRTSFLDLPKLMPANDNADAEEKAVNAAVHEKLDKLLERNVDAPESGLHEKLDKLVDHSARGLDSSILEKLEQLSHPDAQPSMQLEKLDAIHAQMMATAAEVTTFVATQTQRIADEHSTRERESEELALLIAKQTTQKEHLEDDISVLTTEKSDLHSAVNSLRDEQLLLKEQNARLAADLESLHAALAQRASELSAMESKADALERRILENITAAPRPRPRPSPRRPKGRDLRILSSTSTVSTMPASSVAMSRLSIVPPVPKQDRRIMSLSQIQRNAGQGRASLAPSPERTGRVSSFGTPTGKTSWTVPLGGIEEDKENGSRPSSGIGKEIVPFSQAARRSSVSLVLSDDDMTDSAVASIVAAKVRKRIEDGELGYDSGLGSDLPTAVVKAEGGEYFD